MVILFIAAIGGGAFFVSRSSPAETPSPVVLFVDQGTAGIEAPGRLDFKPAGTGSVLHDGETVHVNSGSRASLLFADGSRARLAPDTELSLTVAWINAKGVIPRAVLGQVHGRILYSIAGPPGTDFAVLSNAVSCEVRRGVFEVEMQPDGLETVKVFQGEVKTLPGGLARFAGRVTITAGQQQLYDDMAGTLGPVESLASNPGDPFVQIQRAEAAAAAIGSTPGTEQTFSSLEPLQSGQTVTAGAYATGGGDVTALLANSGSEMQLTITAPGGAVYRAEGLAPVRVTVPAGPPGSYRADVSRIGTGGGGETYAVTFVVTRACDPAEGNGYARKLQGATEMARSVKIAHVSGVKVTPVTLAGNVLLGSSATTFGVGRVAVTALIYATPPSAEVVLLSLRFQGVPMPTRAVGPFGADQVTALNPGFKVDRVYTCTGGFAMEGPSN
jgi:hypothetical protein